MTNYSITVSNGQPCLIYNLEVSLRIYTPKKPRNLYQINHKIRTEGSTVSYILETVNMTVLSVFNHLILCGWCDVFYNFVTAWQKCSGPFSLSTACKNVQLRKQQQIDYTHWNICSAVMLHIMCFHGTTIPEQSEKRPEGLLLYLFIFYDSQ